MTNENQKYIKARQYFTAQPYLEAEYPKLIQKTLKKLDISNLDLKGHLDLRNFPKLEELDCSNNLLTVIDLTNCLNLKKLNGDGNDNLQILWTKTTREQVRFSVLGAKKKPTLEEIKTARLKRQKRKGVFIPNSVIWNDLHLDFNFELSQAWKNAGFTYEQTRNWIDAGFQPQDLELCMWLRDVKQVETEWVLNYAGETELRQAFVDWQQEQIINQIEIQLKIK